MASAAPPLVTPAPDLMRCAALATEAAKLEVAARELDGGGCPAEAVLSYKRAAVMLAESAAVCPDWHRDRPVLQSHLEEVEDRIAYLDGLGGAPAVLPCERHLTPKQLTVTAAQGVEGTRILGFVATFGVAAGLALLGPRCALFCGAGAVHAATRDDSAGHLVRHVGRGGRQVLERASRRAATKLRRIDLRRDVLCRLGEVVFTTRTALGDALLGARAAIAARGRPPPDPA
mmetsp:Transcript_92733/g.206149  ORF Transcript_92733/g.206149 Transcript_92733/m.206149 type:complete len:231 (+) Transcript_92733:51-743(+)